MSAINIVTFKWKKPTTGYRLKNPVEYSAAHVNSLYKAVARNTTLPFKFTCVTDDAAGIDKKINIIHLWDKHKSLGGCYNRLFIFSEEIKNILGERFICIDLDCVIVDNIDAILQRNEEFVINKFIGKDMHGQIYNGGLILMTAGCRKNVWTDFDPTQSLTLLDRYRNEKNLVGSDQAWIQVVLGNNESLFTEADGIYDYSFLPDRKLPLNAKMIFFPGKVDPSQEKDKNEWVAKHWG